MKTQTTQPIVCGTDFSEHAQQAGNVAAAIAKQLRAPLLLVHGVDERGDIPRFYWPRITADDRPELETEAKRLRELGAAVQEEMTGGVPEEGVAKSAEKAGARLIVLGSAGKGALDRWVLGSAVERIAETAVVPTLVVRESTPFESWLRQERALKVFVAADFTPVSDAALRWVADLLKMGKCEITVGFVDRTSDERGELAIFDAMNLSDETPDARQRNERDLRATVAHWVGEQSAVVRVAAGSSRIDTHLLQLAREAHADVIVIGTHQWRGLSRLRHASVSRRILQEAPMSVVCVPWHTSAAEGKGQWSRVQRVLVATDLSEHGNRAVPHAFSVLGSGGMVRLAHVVKPGDEVEPTEARLRGLISSETLPPGVQGDVEVLQARDAAAGICDAADRFDADLICIGSHGRSGLLAAVLGSVAQEVIARSCCPVLVVRPPCAR